MILHKIVIFVVYFASTTLAQKITPIISQATTPTAAATSVIDQPIHTALPKRIAHAGGAINGAAYTSSQEALEQSYNQGYRLIEVDLNVTSDGQIVLLHDWENAYANLSGKFGIDTYANFMSSGHGLTVLDIDKLCDWTTQKPDVRILLDTKMEIYSTFTQFLTRPNCHKEQFVVYIYDLDDYQPVKELGFSGVVFLSRNLSELDVFKISQMKKDHQFSVSLPGNTSPKLFRKLADAKIRTYVWTINELHDEKYFNNLGVYGVITDSLGPW